MRLQPKTLRVFPNPWGVAPSAVLNDGPVDHSTLDHEGRPCGVFVADPITDGGEPGRFVGASRCEKHTVKDAVKTPPPGALVPDEIRSVRQRTVYTFLGISGHETKPYELAEKLAAREPVEIPFSEYYRQGIAEGCLIAADEATAKCADVPFAPPAELFPNLARAAAVAFDAHYNGDAAYEHFVAERAKTASALEGVQQCDAAARAAAQAQLPETIPETPSAKRASAADSTEKESS